MNPPFTNGGDGNGNRDAAGRWVPGNQAARGHGNPNAARVHEIRQAILQSVSLDDVRAVVQTLVRQAKSGDLSAIRELLDRLVGRAGEGADMLEKLAELEALFEAQGGRWS